jgi:hypothetical protein
MQAAVLARSTGVDELTAAWGAEFDEVEPDPGVDSSAIRAAYAGVRA